MSRAWIGTSGYNYNHWRNGVFYPPGLPQYQWLPHYARHFDSVEINLTFYRLPFPEMVRAWRKETPPDFIFALKGSRFITHMKHLKDARPALKNYFDRAKWLKEKLHVVLWQLPPTYHKDTARLEDFVKELARYKSVRHAFEFREASWMERDVLQILQAHNMAVCAHDIPLRGSGKGMGETPPTTAKYMYIRRHGRSEKDGGLALYDGDYSDESLKKDAAAVRKALQKKKDVYFYFNNDGHGYAVKNALTVKTFLLAKLAPV